MIFAHNDIAEEREWGAHSLGVGITISALTTTLNSLKNVITPVGQVCHVRASDLRLSPLRLLTHVLSTISHGP